MGKLADLNGDDAKGEDCGGLSRQSLGVFARSMRNNFMPKCIDLFCESNRLISLAGVEPTSRHLIMIKSLFQVIVHVVLMTG